MTIFKICPGCNLPFTTERKDNTTCSDACRSMLKRMRQGGEKFLFALDLHQVEGLSHLLSNVTPTDYDISGLQKALRMTVENNMGAHSSLGGSK